MARSERADEHFNRSYEIAAGTPLESTPVCYAVCCPAPGLLCGVTDVLGLVNQRCDGPLTIRSRLDGYRFSGGEVVMTLEGPFGQLVGLETEYLGMLALSAAAAHMSAIVDAAGDMDVVDLAARRYPPEICEYVAVAAAVGGAAGTSTPIGHQGVHERFGTPGDGRIQIGTGMTRTFALYGGIPHALSAVYEAGSIQSAAAYHAKFPDEPLTVPIDFEGRERDVCAEAVERFGSSLHAVRLETPVNRVHQGGHATSHRALEMRILSQAPDRAAAQAGLEQYGFGPGVTIEATFSIRDLLDSLGARATKLVVAGSFDAARVRAFKACKAPVDMIGTDSWVNFAAFTSDVIRVFENGQWISRCVAGRADELVEPQDLPVLLAK